MERNDPFPIFSAEIGDGIYLISEERRDAEGQSLGRDITHFGGATGNSYLILGKEKAQLIDSTCCSPGIRMEVSFSMINKPGFCFPGTRSRAEICMAPADACH